MLQIYNDFIKVVCFFIEKCDLIGIFNNFV